MQSQNLPYMAGMNYGTGVNLLTGQVPGKGVVPGRIFSPTGAAGQSAAYNVTIIRSFEDLYRSIGVSVEAGGHYGLFSAEGKFKFTEEVKFNSQSTFLLARVVVENAFQQCEDAQLEPGAAELIRQGKMDVFRTRFGDAFVRGMQTGGEYYALVAVTASSRTQQESTAIALHAQLEAFVASAEVQTQTTSASGSASGKSEIHIVTYQRGGIGEGLGFTRDVSDVMRRLRELPAMVLENPVPYWVQVASYQTLDLPEGPTFVDLQHQRDVLEDCARLRLKLLAARNDVEFVQLHPDYFEDPPELAVLNQWNDHLSRQVDLLKRHASRCAASVTGCEFFTLQLPDDYRTPARKDQAGMVLTADMPRLSLGSMGDAVRTLQTRLQQLGHDLTVDGRFGPKTLQAVKAFQRQRGLSADGIVGPKTWNELRQPA